MVVTSAARTNAVGDRLAAVLPRSDALWIYQPHLVRLNLRILVVLFSAFAMGFDASMMNGLLSLKSWNHYFGTPRSALLGLTNAVLPLGVLTGAFPAGILSDRFGRKASLVTGAVILTAAAIIQACSHNLGTFIASRFVVGLGIEFSIMPAPVLVTELAYPTHRGKVTALYNCFFYVGAIVASWTTFGTYQMAQSTWSWRIPSLLQALCPLMQLTFIWFVPESPRWLVAKNRIEEARTIFVKHHAGGDPSATLVDFQMSEIVASIEAEEEHKRMSWSSLWATKADRKRLCVVLSVPFIAQWAGNGLISYYFSLVLTTVGITSSFDQTLINGILQIFNTFAALFGSLLVDRMGRRKLWLWSCIGMLLSYIAWTICSAVNYNTGGSLSGIFVVVFVFIYFFHYDIAVTPFTWSYPTELLPFNARSKGMALVNFGQGLALMFNSFVNPIALEAIGWKYYIVYCVILAGILLGVYFFFPETRGRSLEEIAEVFGDIHSASGVSSDDRDMSVAPGEKFSGKNVQIEAVKVEGASNA